MDMIMVPLWMIALYSVSCYLFCFSYACLLGVICIGFFNLNIIIIFLLISLCILRLLSTME